MRGQGPQGRMQQGMTLVELLVTLTIAAILLAIGVPAMQSFITSNTLATSANDLIAALNLGRAEAVRCGTNISVTFTYGAGPAATWSVASCSTAAAMRVGSFTDTQLALGGVTPVANVATFDSLGRLVGAAPGGLYGLIVCRGGALAAGGRSTSRAVLVAPTGRIKIAPTDAATGAPLKAAATDVTSCTAL